MPAFHPRPWRRCSVFGEGRRAALDRDQRAKFRFLVRAHARGGRLPAKHEWVGLALLARLGVDGQCDPSHATLAADAGVSERTVQRGLERLAGLGLVSWDRRLVRAGWRCAQTSNAYVLAWAAGAVVSCGRHCGGETLRKNLLSAPRLGGDDAWGRANAARQLRLLAGA